MRGGEADSGLTHSDTSSSTSFPSKAIFAQDGHRPSNHCIIPIGPQAQPRSSHRFSTSGGHTPLQPLAFLNQRPRAIAATCFPQPCGRRSFRTQAFHAATCHVQGSDRGPAGETAVDRSLDTGVGLKTSAKKHEMSLQQTGLFCLA